MKKLILIITVLVSAKVFAMPIMPFMVRADVISFDDKNVKIQQSGKAYTVPRSAILNDKIMAGKNMALEIDRKSFAKIKSTRTTVK